MSTARSWSCFVFGLVRWTGLPFLLRETVQRRRTTILLYHAIAPEELDLHLSVLATRYKFIPLRDYVDALRSGDVRALPPKSMVVTLDDGLMGNYALLDVFRRHQVTPTILVSSGLIGTNRKFWTTAAGSRHEIERLKRVSDDKRLEVLGGTGFTETREYPERSALSRAEIEAMREVVDFQSHSVFHPILNQCSDERSRREIVESKRLLEEEFGLSIYAFAYPNGDFSAREVEYLMEAGYECALTVEVGLNDAYADPFRLKRVSIMAEASESAILVKACPTLRQFKRFVLGADR